MSPPTEASPRRPTIAALRAVVACAAVVAAWFALALAVHPPTEVHPMRGQVVFQSRCAACHAADPASDLGYGPNLADIGRTAATRRVDRSAEEYLFESILHPEVFRAPGVSGVMPPSAADGLSPRAVTNLVAYLMTKGGPLDAARVADASRRVDWNAATPRPSRPLRLEQVEAGREIYLGRGRCATCHPLQRLPGCTQRGPSLLAAGYHDESYLRESLRDPSRQVAAAYQECQITTEDGIPLAGRILRRDRGTCLLLVTSEPRLRVVPIELSTLERDAIAERPLSPMPAPSNLSDADLEALVEFLQTLRY